MQQQDHSFEKLETTLLDKLRDQGCSPVTITGYRYLCNSVFKWLKENGHDFYVEEGGNAFLREYRSKHGENSYYVNLKTVIRRLDDMVKDT